MSTGISNNMIPELFNPLWGTFSSVTIGYQIQEVRAHKKVRYSDLKDNHHQILQPLR